jgi:predicted DNA-binding antitoxin AbrB/MazE fold protein
MAQVTEAIFTHGILKPEGNLALREAQRVRLIIEPIDDETESGDRQAAFDRLRSGIAAMDFFLREPLPSRDALHDRA